MLVECRADGTGQRSGFALEPVVERARVPDPAAALRELEAGAALRHLAFDASGVTAWDSGRLTFVLKVLGETGPRGPDLTDTAR